MRRVYRAEGHSRYNLAVVSDIDCGRYPSSEPGYDLKRIRFRPFPSMTPAHRSRLESRPPTNPWPSNLQGGQKRKLEAVGGTGGADKHQPPHKSSRVAGSGGNPLRWGGAYLA